MQLKRAHKQPAANHFLFHPIFRIIYRRMKAPISHCIIARLVLDAACAEVLVDSDVYSLGVLLYELLTGTTPFDKQRLASAAFDEIRRIIREEEPVRPSTRLSTLGESLSIISTQRGMEPAKLGQLLRGDLDVIVMKALEKDRNRRYDSATALADDVRRFLAQEPIVARPASTAYRLKKFVVRNKIAVSTLAAIAATIFAGLSVSLWSAARARHAYQIAEHERLHAEEQRVIAERERDNTAEQRNQVSAINATLNEQQEAQRKMLYKYKPVVRIDPSGNLIATRTSVSSEVQIIEIASARQVHSLETEESDSIVWSRCGRWLISAALDIFERASVDSVPAKCWDAKTGLLKWEFKSPCNTIAFSSDGSLATAVQSDGVGHFLSVVSMENNIEIQRLQIPEPSSMWAGRFDIAISNDKTHVAIAKYLNVLPASIQVWRLDAPNRPMWSTHFPDSIRVDQTERRRKHAMKDYAE